MNTTLKIYMLSHLSVLSAVAAETKTTDANQETEAAEQLQFEKSQEAPPESKEWTEMEKANLNDKSSPTLYMPHFPERGNAAEAQAERLVIQEKDFSLVPPPNWLVKKNYPNLSLMMVAPPVKDEKYQRNITVMRFAGNINLTLFDAQEFGKKLAQNYKSSDSRIVDYNLRNHSQIKLASGRDAILFYSDYKIIGVNLMQANVLVPLEQTYFVLTFTDLVEHFESKDAGSTQVFEEAWNSLMSFDSVSSPYASEVQRNRLIGIIALTTIGLIFGLVLLRNYIQKRQYRNLMMESEFAGNTKYDSTTSSVTTNVSKPHTSKVDRSSVDKFTSNF